MFKRRLLLFLSVFVYLFEVQAQQKAEFINPVIPGDYADPTVIKIGDTYYAAGTSSEWAPFYPMYASSDLVNWTQTGYIFDKKPEWTLASFWAPELFYYNDKVYAYYTARNLKGVTCIGVATADKPTGPFTDHGVIIEYGTEAIDAFILEDKGELYISWKAYGLDNRPIELLGCKLSKDGLRLEGEPFSLMRDDEGIGMEGQHWFKDGDYYYMLYSVKSCCGPGSDYQVYVGRSKNLKGPYEKYEGNPILYGDGSDFISCGHGTFTTTPDNRMFYLFHAYLSGDRFYGGRQGILQEMVIDANKWPQFVTGSIGRLHQKSLPFENTIQEPVITNFEDHFKEGKLSNIWTWNFVYSDIDTKTGNNLKLSGTPLGDNKYGTALCVRPVWPEYTYETEVVNKNNSFKGLTMYGDSKNLVAFGVKDNRLILEEIKDDKDTILYEYPSDAKVYLKMKVSKGRFCTFLWSKDGKTWQTVDGIKDRDYTYLVRWDRVARPGLIHMGEKEHPAEFSYFKLNNLTEQ